VAPRTYQLQRRAETTDATRQRIVDAAVTVYRERGMPGATIQAIAERANVSRGTVVNHFGGTDGLLSAVLDRVVEELDYPHPRQLSGAVTLEDRIHRFVEVMYRFFGRGNDWWEVFGTYQDVPELKAREQAYWGVLAGFQAAAFGELVNDKTFAAAVRAFVDYGPRNALMASGLTVDEAIDLVAGALLGIARQRVG
jgi:AcrR family transcriptional regulator